MTGRSVLAFAASYAGCRLAAEALVRQPPGGHQRWTRRNHRGEPVTLLEGPALAVGAAAALLLPVAPSRLRAAALLSTVGAAGLGAHDDLAGDVGSKGLRGHLAALRRGHVTTGAVKLGGLGLVGLVSAALVERRKPGGGLRVGPAAAVADLLVDGAVVAAAANVVNLLDLRPGRALKVVLGWAAFVPAAGRPLAAVAAGAAVALLPDDLAERSMLGDTGANAAGALLGVASIAGHRPAGRRLVLGVLTGLTLASEWVSFTRLIASTAWLRRIDELGRRPAAQVP